MGYSEGHHIDAPPPKSSPLAWLVAAAAVVMVGLCVGLMIARML